MNKFALALVLLALIFFISGCVGTRPEIHENITNITNETNYSEATENFPPVREPVRECETDADCYNSSYAINKCITDGNDTYCRREGHITCYANSDCEPAAGEYALCTFPGTVNSTCFILKKGVLPGDPMNCKKDSECDDNNSNTEDMCAIVNDSYSFCSHITEQMK